MLINIKIDDDDDIPENNERGRWGANQANDNFTEGITLA
jgi:hypothetical protein